MYNIPACEGESLDPALIGVMWIRKLSLVAALGKLAEIPCFLESWVSRLDGDGL